MVENDEKEDASAAADKSRTESKLYVSGKSRSGAVVSIKNDTA